MQARKTLSTKLKATAFSSSLLCLCIALPITALADLNQDFLTARQAYAQGDAAVMENYAQKLQGSPLEPYADYWRLSMNLGNGDAAPVLAFLDRYRGSLLAEHLRKAWLKFLAKSQQWQLFYEQYPELANSDTALFCSWLQARKSLGDENAQDEARSLWFSGSAQPESCEPLFNALIASDAIARKDIWKRLRLVLESGNVTLARQINGILPKMDAMRDKSLVSSYENPYRYLDRNKHPGTRAEREIAIFAVMRIARANPAQAMNYWSKIGGHFSEGDRKYVQGKIALHAALKHMPQALQWFDVAGNTLDDQEIEWEVRAALREKIWTRVLSGIAALSPDAQKEESWRYWKARALESQGKPVEANAIFAALSHERDFYGQLALDEMGTVVTRPTDAYTASEEDIAAVANVPGIQRALLLYSMGLRLDATREWIWAVRDFDDRTLLAAAELARRRGLYDRAINTAEKSTTLDDFSLRFLAPYRDIMHVQTQQLDLDEAWVYGLIRQESRFVTAAKSGVGASGLMQLMPATAKWVASKLGLRNFHHSLVSQLETNISLGTYYLKHILVLLDNQPVLASAAYNAGPVRAQQWVGTQPMEGAIYIETIPFGETRNYVKKVMSNTEYYASSFGQERLSLKQRLGIIGSVNRNDP